MLYQIGALKGFLEVAGIELHHIKPHGALYSMAAQQEHIAHAVADVAEHFRVPLSGSPTRCTRKSTLHAASISVAEFFADLDYDADGSLLVTRHHDAVDPDEAATRVVRAVSEGLVRTVAGTDAPVRAATICVHSDTPGCVAIAQAVKSALEAHQRAGASS